MICSTSDEGEDCSDRLRQARPDRRPEHLPPRVPCGLHRDRDAGALGDVLDRDCNNHEEGEAVDRGGHRRAQSQSLREAVDEEDDEDQESMLAPSGFTCGEVPSARRGISSRKTVPVERPAITATALPSSRAGSSRPQIAATAITPAAMPSRPGRNRLALAPSSATGTAPIPVARAVPAPTRKTSSNIAQARRSRRAKVTAAMKAWIRPSFWRLPRRELVDRPIEQQAHRRRLAGAVRSEEAEDLTALDPEIELEDAMPVPGVLAQARRLDRLVDSSMLAPRSALAGSPSDCAGLTSRARRPARGAAPPAPPRARP